MSILNKLAQWLPFGKVPEMSAQEVYKRLQKNDIQVIDVRSKIEWNKSHIEGSINLPITSLSIDAIKQLELSQDLTTVVICLSAHRSIPGVRKLKQFGFTDVYQLEGGMLSWWKLSLPTSK
ncbi:rhodanese-like domain-containing protein [Shewanella frigidimarina]|uniref:rhodanese-like domain-containing protein n=1 Tax=Shewanella TaxID=22 RepID=UPI0015FFD6F3|nr:rhodanese-like domain-containing protein [Shewanella sp. SG44-2]MBB1427610.1 rhodanese-like domain-containing protein [Shewanella sp. SG44-2]